MSTPQHPGSQWPPPPPPRYTPPPAQYHHSAPPRPQGFAPQGYGGQGFGGHGFAQHQWAPPQGPPPAAPAGYANPPRPPQQAGQYPPPPQYRQPTPPNSGTPSYGAPSYGAPSYGAPSYGAPSQAAGYTAQAPGYPAPRPQTPQQSGYGYLQPNFGQPPAGAYLPPKRRSNPIGVVLLVIFGVFVFGAIALTVTGLGNQNTTENGTDGGGNPRYVNEDYTPPAPELNPSPLPKPTTVSEATSWLEANALYRQTMPAPVACDITPLDLSTATEAEAEEHLSTLAGCLTGAWSIPMEQAGFEMPRPPVTVYGASGGTGACGKLEQGNAQYCGANQQIYYGMTLIDALPELGRTKYGVELVMAHEFGHAVQGRSGIIYARAGLMNMASSEAEALEINRRLEAQADCLATMFMASAAQAMGMTEADLKAYDPLLQALGGPGPGRTHPSGASRLYWGNMGLKSANISQCNTFTAPANTVR